MHAKTMDHEIEYRPPFAGRLARILIPALSSVLPSSIYRVVYDLLYGTYKRWLIFVYALIVLKNKMFGDYVDNLRVSLTWRLLPYSMGGRRALENAFDSVAKVDQSLVEGALVECGVAQGGTAAMLALANREIGNVKRQKWFFDSYEGLPEPTEEDYDKGKVGEFIRPLPKGSCLGTIEQVSELMFDKLLFPVSEIHLIKGWFQDTVPVYRDSIGPIAVLRLDGDWYESTKIPLENFYSHVSDGGIVIVDDYATCFGSRKATDEFREKHNITSPLIPDGRGGAWFEKS